MKFVKFAPSHLTSDQMIQQSQDTENGLTTNNADLPTPPVAPAALAAQRGIVDTKQNERKAAQLLVEQKASEEATEKTILGQMLLQDATYVDGVCIGNPNNANSLANKGGFSTKQAPVHSGSVPPAVHGFSVTLGDQSTWADYHFDALHGINSPIYKVYYNVDNPTAPFDQNTWQLGDSTNVSSGTLKGLTIHQPIAFCVVAHNTNGDGPPSSIVVKTLL